MIEHDCPAHPREGRSADGRYWGATWIITIEPGAGVAFPPLWLSVN